LDPDLTFDTFVTDPSNELASQVLQELPFNPILIYGPKNSGKTHLLTSCAHRLQKQGKKIFFVKAEKFTEHVVQAIRLGLMQEFRNIYREIDALFIDDVHIFSGKNATQEEFFHTFNTLHTILKPIVLSAHAAPTLLTGIEPRLISRFEWGISLGIKEADRVSILQKKAAAWNTPLKAELAQYLVETFPTSSPAALQALILRSKGKRIEAPKEAEALLKDLIAAEEKNSLTAEEIAKAVANHYGVRYEDILGKSQTREMALPRQMAMYLCRERLKLTYQKIGEIFGRDHSTVMSSVKLIEKGMQTGESGFDAAHLILKS
jgi:chromosomal replication initiator protein